MCFIIVPQLAMYTIVTMYFVFAIKRNKWSTEKVSLHESPAKLNIWHYLLKGVEKFWNFWREILRSYIGVWAV